MVDHPAMPKFDDTLTSRQLMSDGSFGEVLTPKEAAELAFRSVVEWLEGTCTEHSRLCADEDGALRNYRWQHRRQCPDCTESLRKAEIFKEVGRRETKK